MHDEPDRERHLSPRVEVPVQCDFVGFGPRDWFQFRFKKEMLRQQPEVAGDKVLHRGIQSEFIAILCA